MKYKKQVIQTLLILLSITMVIILGIEMLRSITKFPKVYLALTPSQNEIYKTINVWELLGRFGGQFAFFTIWTNVLLTGSLCYKFILKKNLNKYWQNALATYSIIMMLVFFAMLAPYLPWGQSPWFDFIYIYSHVIIVMIYLIWYFYIKDFKVNNIKSAKITMIMPLVYLAWTLIIYASSGGDIAVYPFLNFKNIYAWNLPVFGSTVLAILSIVGIAFLIILTNYLLNKLSFKKISL